MRFHSLITYFDPDMDQVEMLVVADDYIPALELIEGLCGEPESIRMRALDVVNPPADFPTEIYIKKEGMR